MSNARNLANLLSSDGTVPNDKLGGSITASKIADGSITESKLANSAVTPTKLSQTYMTGISAGSVTAAMLDTTYMTGISAGSITDTELATGAVTSAKIASGAAVSNIGYTPANKAGDTFTGNVNISGAVVATGNITGFGTV